MLLGAISALITSYVVAHFVDMLNIVDFNTGWQFAFWAWLGLIAPVQLGSVLWESRSWKYFLINTSYQLVALTLVTLINAYWI